MKISSSKSERDYDFGQHMLTLRTRLGLTQAQKATLGALGAIEEPAPTSSGQVP